MFLIASTGRCGTEGLCTALDEFSNHEVRHERPPQLLYEAWAKHHGEEFRTPRFTERLEDYASRAKEAYGESIRTPNLLEEILTVVPDCRLLVLVRDPHRYALSAFAKGATRGNGDWDRYRLIPAELEKAQKTAADTLLGNWTVVNQLLLNLAVSRPDQVAVACMRPWEQIWQPLTEHLGVEVTDIEGFLSVLGSRRNRTRTDVEIPELNISETSISACQPLWDQAQRLNRWE